PEYIGFSGTATFNHAGGNHTASTLYLGKNAGSIGTYALSNSASLAVTANEYVGDLGTANFIQSGGSNIVGGDLVVGQNAGSVGTYTLAGGMVSAANFYVAPLGNSASSMNVTGGSLAVTGSIRV